MKQKRYRVTVTVVQIHEVRANNMGEAKIEALSRRADDAYTKSVKVRLVK